MVLPQAADSGVSRVHQAGEERVPDVNTQGLGLSII